VGTINISKPVEVGAQVGTCGFAFGDAPCSVDQTCPGGPDKVRICHVDKGGPPHDICVNASDFNSHCGPGGHARDFCLGTGQTKKCE
jgi:hypothetical protein